MMMSIKPGSGPPPPGEEPVTQETWELRLYVAGVTPKSAAAFKNLERICEQHMPGKFSIEVIDLLKNPERAKEDEIVAVPTLVRRLPPPIRKIVGDLSNEEKTLIGLQLRSRRPLSGR